MDANKNMLNQKFGLLTVVDKAESGVKKSPGTYWRCICDCGGTKIVLGSLLRKGATRSCGCLSVTAGLSARKPKGYSGLTKLFNGYRDAAAKRKLEFSLSRRQFENLTSSNCYYCGQSPSSISKATSCVTEDAEIHSAYKYNGIDRINNDHGYVLNNCTTACERCNRAKYTFSKESFLNWVDKIYLNRHKI